MGSRRQRPVNAGTTQEFGFLDIRHLRAEGHLVDGESRNGGISLPSLTQPESSLFFRTNLRDVEKSQIWIAWYNWKGQSGETNIRLVSRQMRMGGRRWYFCCPIDTRLCEKLYLTAGGWMSRKAAKLCFESQSESYRGRLFRRRSKVQGLIQGTATRGPLRGERRARAQSHLHAIEASLEGSPQNLRAYELTRQLDREIRRRRVAKLEKDLNAARSVYIQNVCFIEQYETFVDLHKLRAIHDGTVPDLNLRRREPRIAETKLPTIDLPFLQRLGCAEFGVIRGAWIRWTPEQIAKPGRSIVFLLDWRAREHPCFMIILNDSGNFTTQPFWLQRARGVAGRQELRFICPKTDYLSRTLVYRDGRFATPAALFGDPDKLFPDFKVKLPW